MARRKLRPPRQIRSAEKLARILEVAWELMESRDLHEVGVEEIARTAGASLSSFYARFPTKEALIEELHSRFCAETVSASQAWLEENRGVARSFPEAARTVIHHYLAARRKNLARLRTFIGAESRDRELLEKRKRADHQVYRTALEYLEQVRRPGDPWPSEDALERALNFVAATARSATDAPERMHRSRPVSDAQLVDELTEMALRYLFPGDPGR